MVVALTYEEKTKQTISEYYEKAMLIAHRHDIAMEELRKGRGELSRFRVNVPVIGSFNTGKSALLNGVMGCNLLPTSVAIETAAPTELNYGESRLLVERGFGKQRIGVGDLRSSSFDKTGIELMELFYPSPVLRELDHLCLVDMPGLDSGNVGHDRAIRSYMPKSLAYLLVFSAEEPVLKESVCNFLSELQLREIPVYIVLTKCDKVTMQEQKEAIRFFRKTLAEQLDLHTVSISTISAKPVPKVEELLKVLMEINHRADNLCYRAYSSRLLRSLQGVSAVLEARLSSQRESIQEIENHIRGLRGRIERWEEDVDRWEKDLVDSLDAMKAGFITAFMAQLRGIVPILEGELRSKENGGMKLLYALKNVVIALIKSEIEPNFQRQLRSLQTTITYHSSQDGRENEINLLSQFEQWNSELDLAKEGEVGSLNLINTCMEKLNEEVFYTLFKEVQEAYHGKKQENISLLIEEKLIVQLSNYFGEDVLSGLTEYCTYISSEIRHWVTLEWKVTEETLQEMIVQHSSQEQLQQQDLEEMRNDDEVLNQMIRRLQVTEYE